MREQELLGYSAQAHTYTLSIHMHNFMQDIVYTKK